MSMFPGDDVTTNCEYIFPVFCNLYPQALSSALALLGCHSSGPSGYKFRRPLGFEVQLLFK